MRLPYRGGAPELREVLVVKGLEDALTEGVQPRDFVGQRRVLLRRLLQVVDQARDALLQLCRGATHADGGSSQP